MSLAALVSATVGQLERAGDPVDINDRGFIAAAGVDSRTGATHAYLLEPIVSAGDLLASLSDAVAGVGPGKSLAVKVAHAEAYSAAGDTLAACSMLDAFARQVKALAGKKIDADVALRLMVDADSASAAMGCSNP